MPVSRHSPRLFNSCTAMRRNSWPVLPYVARYLWRIALGFITFLLR
jgi:hypothetical protein